MVSRGPKVGRSGKALRIMLNRADVPLDCFVNSHSLSPNGFRDHTVDQARLMSSDTDLLGSISDFPIRSARQFMIRRIVDWIRLWRVCVGDPGMHRVDRTAECGPSPRLRDRRVPMAEADTQNIVRSVFTPHHRMSGLMQVCRSERPDRRE